ncbi:MAG: DUF1476 domain-containing protein [Planctomycetota bacterium]
MSGYDERQQAMDTKLAQDSEFRFKVTNRRNRLLGMWAAEQIGVADDAAEAYAKSVVMSDFEQPGEDDVVRKVLADFQENGVGIDETQLRKKMAELLPVAQKQIHNAS